MSLKQVKHCSTTQKREIEDAADWVAENWSDFEDFLENRTGLNIKKCMENRFKKNGKVVCEEATGQCKTSKGNNAWASMLNKKVHLCPSFLNRVNNLSGTTNRRACYIAILSHEFAHTCDRFEPGSERIDDAAFDFFSSRNPGLTIRLAQCGMD